MSITVQAIRFTPDVARLSSFYEALGLVAVVTAPGWAVMRSASGDVLLHDAATASAPVSPGQTDLSFETDALDELASRLDVTPIDEAYGRHIELTTPGGNIVWVNERQDDFYGYEQHSLTADPRISIAVTVPRDTSAEFLTSLGLVRKAASLDEFADPRGAGTVVLEDIPAPQTQLLVTDLAAWTRDVRDRGLEVTSLAITDPDGNIIQIRPA